MENDLAFWKRRFKRCFFSFDDRWKNKPKIFARMDDAALIFCQKLFNCMPETVVLDKLLKAE